MQTLIKIVSELFIGLTALAMFVHSQWTFNILFTGHDQPVLNGVETIVPFLLWFIPGAGIAFAIEFGQVATSYLLKRARTWGRRVPLIITFLVLALAGFYLQWFALAHHMPALEFGAGLSVDALPTATRMKDAALWIIPALLPLSTLVFTLSGIGESAEQKEPEIQPVETPAPLPIVEVPALAEPALKESYLLPVKHMDETDDLPPWLRETVARCECGWESTYKDAKAARMGLNGHRRHCELLQKPLSANGHTKEASHES